MLDLVANAYALQALDALLEFELEKRKGHKRRGDARIERFRLLELEVYVHFHASLPR
jgi:hypothetical protein